MDVDESELKTGQANIKVFGVGGGGGNAANWLYLKGIEGAEVIIANTDKQHLDLVEADRKFLLGKDLTRGLGAGGDPTKGKDAAQESISKIKDSLKGADMVFVTAGMGGGTGTGGAPVIAEAAKEMDAIVIGCVTMPFKIERARVDKAEHGLQMLRDHCDTVVVIDNERLVKIAGDLPVRQAFAVANELISTMIKGIVETISTPSLVNLDFADVQAVMRDGHIASVGVGSSNTKNRVDEAVEGALSNPLLEIDYEGATGAIIQIQGGEDMTLDEISTVGERVTEAMDHDAEVIWGAQVTEEMNGEITVMTIMTGVNSPYLLGKNQEQESEEARQELSNELGIQMVK
jgi:cell division protein FtsZ